jgi:hypothetical protein
MSQFFILNLKSKKKLQLLSHMLKLTALINIFTTKALFLAKKKSNFKNITPKSSSILECKVCDFWEFMSDKRLFFTGKNVRKKMNFWLLPYSMGMKLSLWEILLFILFFNSFHFSLNGKKSEKIWEKYSWGKYLVKSRNRFLNFISVVTCKQQNTT